MEQKKNKGQAQLGPIFALVGFAIIMVVGTMVFSSFDTSASAIITTTQATASLSNITTSTYSGMNIMSIGPIVLAAILILAIVTLLSRAK